MHHNRLVGVLMLSMAAAVAFRLTPTVHGQSAELVNFEGSQTNPIRLSPDGTRLFAVNTANASLSVFDVSNPTAPFLIREIPVGLEPVSVNPRTRNEAWVVNQLSDSVSIVSVSRGIVVATLQIPDEPMDVVFAGLNQAFVSVSRSNAIAVADTAARVLTHRLPLSGGNPRALAVSPDGRKVYAAFAMAGNATTIIPWDVAPPQPPPTNPNLPPAPGVAKIVSANDPAWSSVGYRMPDNDVAVITTGPSLAVARYYSRVGTVNLGLAVNPATGDLFVANTEARNLVRFAPNLRGHWVENRVSRIEVASAEVTPFDLNPLIDYSILPNAAARATALAQPTAVVFDPSGEFMHVAAFGTDRVAQVDTSGNVLSFVEVSPPSGSGSNVDPKTKRGPRGLAVRAGGRTLYVLNRISNTISVIDTAANAVVGELRVGTDPTPPAVRAGRGFLYDAKLSGNGTGSCASCHVDGDLDHLAWDLGDPGGEMSTFEQGETTFEFHPMKGPMTTQTLRGLAGTGPLHWRGDKASFLDFNPAFEGLMGGLQLSSSDMRIYAAFVDTILFHPNPNQNLDRSLPAALGGGNPVAGREVFMTVAETPPGVTCHSCHTADPGPGTNGRIDHPAFQTQPLKTPQLRNIYQKLLFTRSAARTIDGFGMDHDGRVSNFTGFFKAPGFSGYTAQQKLDLGAYMMAFDTGTAPAVGHTITVTADNIDGVQLRAQWATLQQQAVARNIDLVVRGTVNGRVRALSYRPSSDDYTIDGLPTVSLTPMQLRTLIERGDTLTFMGVPPREGTGPASASHSPATLATTATSGQGSANRGH